MKNLIIVLMLLTIMCLAGYSASASLTESIEMPKISEEYQEYKEYCVDPRKFYLYTKRNYPVHAVFIDETRAINFVKGFNEMLGGGFYADTVILITDKIRHFGDPQKEIRVLFFKNECLKFDKNFQYKIIFKIYEKL